MNSLETLAVEAGLARTVDCQNSTTRVTRSRDTARRRSLRRSRSFRVTDVGSIKVENLYCDFLL